jgi:glycosyltransferase domain-containing protein
MRVNDPKTFAFVMSTRNRPAYVRRTVDFLQRQSFSGRLLVVDASDETPAAANRQFLAGVGNMQIQYFAKRVGNNWIETADGCDTLDSRFMLWHHDDDFYFIDTIENALEALERDRDAACAQGREIFLGVNAKGTRVDVNVGLSPRFAYLGASPTDRLQQTFGSYCHLFFSVIRREIFVEACRLTAQHLSQGWFDQYAWGLIVAARGRVLLSDQFSAARQKHQTNHSRLISAYDHWPLIVASPDFSRIFSDFKSCLVRAVGEEDSGRLREIIDHGLVSLIGRVHGIGHQPDAVDSNLIKSCVTRGTPEEARVASIVEAVMRHPGTF